MKFSIGDKVMHEVRGNGKVVAINGGTEPSIGVQYKKALDSGSGHSCKSHGKDGFCWWEMSDTLTLRPATWTRVEDGLPDSTKDVRVKLLDGSKCSAWNSNANWHGALPGEVIAWKPIKRKEDAPAPAPVTRRCQVSGKEWSRLVLGDDKDSPPVERIPVGAKVVIRGTLVRDDLNAFPYVVEMATGRERHFTEGDVELEAHHD